MSINLLEAWAALHWLKIKQRIQCKIISITHNLLDSATPFYLYRLLNIQPTRPTCSTNCLCLAHPKLTSGLKLSDRSFRNAAPSLWNKLPTTLHSLPTEATRANPVPFLPLALSHQKFLNHLKTSFHSLLSFLCSFYPLCHLPFSTSHCPFLVVLLSAGEYTSISWFCGHYNLLLSIYQTMCSHAWCGVWSKSSYIKDVLVPLIDLPAHSRLRSAAAGQYDVRFIRTQFGHRALSIATPTEWNILPANLRSIADITAFKKAIKTHFFRQGYS